MTRILVAGGEGYIGSLLIPKLISKGYAVRVVDLGWYHMPMDIESPTDLEFILGDVCNPNLDWFSNVDVVINLSGVSNDPTAELWPRLNFDYNSTGTALLASKAKEAKVKKFIQASSCSVYGWITEGLAKEDINIPSPKYPYGVSKLMSESACLSLMETGFDVIILRKGTVGGYAPRMRFDLVVNTMTKSALKDQKIVVRNSNLWRPLVDVEDVVGAYLFAIEKEMYGVYNVVQSNYTILSIGQAVQSTLISAGYKADLEVHNRFDVRNYKASNDKLGSVGYYPYRSVNDTVRSILANLESLGDLDNPEYYNIEVMKLMLEENND